MDYFKIKAEAEVIRDAAGLMPQVYPVFIRIETERVACTGHVYGVPEQWEPQCAVGLANMPVENKSKEAAFCDFKEEVRQEALRVSWEARRIDVKTRWAARRASRQ